MHPSSAPDFLEPLVGYRAWRLDSDGGLSPWSVWSAAPWLPGVNEAECHQHSGKPGKGKPHRPPGLACMCGLYALARLEDPRLAGRSGQAVGAIVAWGGIELHRTGFRAENAQIVALATSEDPGMADALRVAAERYGVPLLPRDEIPAAAAQYGAPVEGEVLHPEYNDRRRTERHVGERGVALLEHVWARPDSGLVSVGITQPFASLLDGRAEITCAPVGTQVSAGDPLAMVGSEGETLIVWSCVSGTVVTRNETVLTDPQRLAAGNGAEWLVSIDDTDWPHDAANFVWSKRGVTSYAAQIDRRHAGEDVFSEIRAARHFTGAPMASAADVLAELERRRHRPAFADEADVYAQCAPQVRGRLAARPAMSRRLAGRNVRLRCVTYEPRSTMTIHPREGRTMLTCGESAEPADLTLEMPATTAKKLFGGQLDIVRALRRHEVTSSASLAETLRSFSVLKDLFARNAG